jgi:hypothetical protein
MDERRKRKTTEFLVKWEKGGARADDNMWEPLEHVKEHLEAFASSWRARASA